MIDDLFEIIPVATEKNYSTMADTHGYVDSAPNGQPIAAIIPDLPINYITILEFEEDGPRGKHYHRKKHEYMMPIRGHLQVNLRRPDDHSSGVDLILKPGTMLHILPGCVHTFTAIGGDATAIEYSPQPYEAEDVFYDEVGGQ